MFLSPLYLSIIYYSITEQDSQLFLKLFFDIFLKKLLTNYELHVIIYHEIAICFRRNSYSLKYEQKTTMIFVNNAVEKNRGTG